MSVCQCGSASDECVRAIYGIFGQKYAQIFVRALYCYAHFYLKVSYGHSLGQNYAHFFLKVSYGHSLGQNYAHFLLKCFYGLFRQKYAHFF